ncbi:hypothetical protein BJI69_14405 [Luteibacter rhizovicinus DSM 16549]|uniref:Uncharacterized protein n=1 Tax=Luteibacter rhizovicinus DSM 16549 TaxID=1440763 RepID=A0A0G9HF60_9GAMM|nr:hypothetical protein [Luteibacter rhizovicinus]APG04967.1 hypothetical protein BJI69_14405 [Luteibacter rhizovicinus DSM 16549]KLD68440.1 hypothetical protein Y883_01750 [Luteibacter rhizovicinus DSM 16549]
MAITRLNFNTLADGGDDATGAFQKLDANDLDLDTRVSVAKSEADATAADLALLHASLGSASTKSVGTSTGTVAAGDDARFVYRGRRNLLINGDASINQIVFSGGAMGANAYGYDMWRTFGATASFTRASNGSTMTLNGTIGQIIEAPSLQSATVTVSLSNPSGAVTVNIRPDATTAGVSGVIPAGSGAQSVTLVVPSSITGNVFVQLTTTSAVTFDGPAKQSGIQLELGSFASAFERLTVPERVQQCQRYYWKSFLESVVPANGSGSLTGAISYIITTGSAGAGFNGLRVPFPVKMRAAPSITFFNPLGFSVNWININLNANSGTASVGTTGISEGSLLIVNQQLSSDQAPHTICVHMTADARL